MAHKRWCELRESGDEAGDSTRELLPTRTPYKAVWRPCIPSLGTLHIALKGKTCAFGNITSWHGFCPLLPLCSIALQGKELKKITSVKAMWSVTAACTVCVCILRGKPMVSPLFLHCCDLNLLLACPCDFQCTFTFFSTFTKLHLLKVLQKYVEFVTESSINTFLPTTKWHNFNLLLIKCLS